jgi:hypothetical protein
LARVLLAFDANLRLFAFESHMKTPVKRNPLAWMAAMLMGVVLWGCKTDRDESLTVTDNRLVARTEVDRSVPWRPDPWMSLRPQLDLLVPQPVPGNY